MDTSPLADEANTADWISAIGQAAGAFFTAAAVVVALGIAITDLRRRRREDEERARRNARMVRVRGTGIASDTNRSEDGFAHRVKVYFSNHGDRPIFNVRAEVWPEGTALDKDPAAVTKEIVLPGEPAEPHEYFTVRVPTPMPEFRLAAWRVRWTDVDGREWCGDVTNQFQPLPFTGQPPRPHGSVETSR